MSVTRRTLLQAAPVAVAAIAAGPARLLAVPPAAALLVFDSRLPQSRALQRRYAGQAVDLAQEHANLWRRLRSLGPGGLVVGLTSWSDLVQARGLLGEQGRRLRVAARCGRLYYWEMA